MQDVVAVRIWKDSMIVKEKLRTGASLSQRKDNRRMDIRNLSPGENGKTRALYEEVFEEDSKGFVDYYYMEKTKDNQIYVIEEDEAIRAMLHLNPYHLYVNGSEKEVNYIVAVATQKEYRKRGYMANLLKQALRDEYRDGKTFTFLMPASESIYIPYDFRTVYEQNKRVYCEQKENEMQQKDDFLVVEDAKEKDCKELAEFANSYLLGQYQVFAIRDSAYYQRLIKEYASDGGSLKIYRKEGKITDCLGWYPEETAEEKEKPKIMVRIVDVRRMLMSLSLRSLMSTCFCVIDPIIVENNRCVVITGTEFSGVMLMDGKPENSEGTITVAALASLVFGAKTVEEVCQEEGVEMSERMKAEMKKIIPLSKIYLNEVV